MSNESSVSSFLKFSELVQLRRDGDANSQYASFFLMAGPCVIESLEHCLKIGRAVKEICDAKGIKYIFKASFDKANRTSLSSYRGPGLEEGLRILAAVKEELGVPVVTDVHEPGQCELVASVADILQIPAFLCRQTDLLLAAGKTGRIINVKKGQFCSTGTMSHAVNKIRDGVDLGGENGLGDGGLMLCDRGTQFGYGDLIVDFRSLTRMRRAEPSCLIVQDCTHALQQPNVAGTTMGCRDLIPTICRAAVAVGVDGLFMEVHDNPEEALSDKTTQFPLNKLSDLLTELLQIHQVTHGRSDF